jgi:hypothetical protein
MSFNVSFRSLRREHSRSRTVSTTPPFGDWVDVSSKSTRAQKAGVIFSKDSWLFAGILVPARAFSQAVLRPITNILYSRRGDGCPAPHATAFPRDYVLSGSEPGRRLLRPMDKVLSVRAPTLMFAST